MLSADEKLNEETLRGILKAGHSRVPVHRPGSRQGTPLFMLRLPCPHTALYKLQHLNLNSMVVHTSGLWL